MPCHGLAVPLARGRARRNALYGVRFAKSFRSEQAWAEINRYGGKRMIIWSLPLIVVGVTPSFLPFESRTALTSFLAFAPPAFVLAPVVEV